MRNERKAEMKIKRFLHRCILFVFITFVVSMGCGTLFWMLYPHIHALFPAAMNANILPVELRWWDAVCITWILELFFPRVILDWMPADTEANELKEDNVI